MKTITMVLEATSDSVWACSENEEGIYGVGDTIQECKQSVLECIELMKQKDPGCEIPEFLKGEYQIVYKYNMESLLQYYKGIFTNSALERLTGINQKQIQHYAVGLHKPRKKQTEKIQNALHDLGRELLSIRL